MTDILWTGATDTSLNETTNYTPNQLPIAGDRLYADGSAIRAPATDMSQFSAIKLGLLFIGPDWSLGDWGTSSKPFDTALTKLNLQQREGTVYYNANATAGITTDAVVNTTVTGEESLVLSGDGNITYCVITKGLVSMASYTGTITDLVTSFVSSPASDAIISGVGSSAGINILHAYGGDITTTILPAEAKLNRCSVHVLEDAALTGAGTYWTLHDGAELRYDDDTTITELHVVNGEADLTKVTRPLTVSIARVWPNEGKLKYNELVTITPEDMLGGNVAA